MKKIIFAFAMCSFAFTTKTIAQSRPDSTMVERFLLDFSVPDMPAFKALGTEPSSILRPSDIKKFAAMVSPFYSNGKAVIPKNFALETAPWKLSSKDWTLNDYTTKFWKRFGYHSSFSLGAISDSTSFPLKMALGYRVSFLSKRADVFRAAEIRNKVFPGMLDVMPEFTQLTNYWVNNIVKPAPAASERPTYYRNHREEFNEFLSTIGKFLEDHPDAVLQGLFDTLIAKLVADNKAKKFTPAELKQIIQVYGKSIDVFIEEYQEKNWNASRLDIGLAWVGQCRDSLLSNAQFSSFSVWVTGALRVHMGGQLLLGINPVFPRSINDSARIHFAGSLRYYLGTQDFRGFLELQYKTKKYEILDRSLLVNLGAEFRLANNFWVVASAGIDNYLGEADPINKLISSIDLRYGFNKPKK